VTLTTLRQRGHALALVTNCSAETEVALDRLELRPLFDVLALSSSIKAAKPDPAIYQYAIDGLGIDPATAVFVGDGDTEEHAGAARFGMTTVLLKRPGATERNVQTDYTITSLLELLDLPALQG
jgi:putative hydrolase of the HAD superfamily